MLIELTELIKSKGLSFLSWTVTAGRSLRRIIREFQFFSNSEHAGEAAASNRRCVSQLLQGIIVIPVCRLFVLFPETMN